MLPLHYMSSVKKKNAYIENQVYNSCSEMTFIQPPIGKNVNYTQIYLYQESIISKFILSHGFMPIKFRLSPFPSTAEAFGNRIVRTR